MTAEDAIALGVARTGDPAADVVEYDVDGLASAEGASAAADQASAIGRVFRPERVAPLKSSCWTAVPRIICTRL